MSGCVNIRVAERLKCNSISMLLNGRSRVHWSETRGTGKQRSTRHYSAEEQYLNANIIFLSKQPNSDLYLEPGDYSYPFQIVLPPNLPTSFEHTYGQVRYSINGTIDIPWAFDKHTTRSFSVINNVDLNLCSPALRQPYGVSGSKVFCCWCCASEPVTAKFNILKSGFVPGESILFNAEIDNRSNRELDSIKVKLVQDLKFHATTKSRTSQRNVAEVVYSNVIRPCSIESWNKGTLVIPPVCPSSNGACKIIEISYSVVFVFGASNSIDSNLAIPIYIGTIPLRQLENTSNNTSSAYPSAPSYQECMFGANPNQEFDSGFQKGELIESDLSTFKPFYPYYKDYSIQN